MPTAARAAQDLKAEFNCCYLLMRDGTLLEFPIIEESSGFPSKRRRLRNENLKTLRDCIGGGGEAIAPNTRISALFHGHSQASE